MDDFNKWLSIRKNLYIKTRRDVLYRLGKDSAAFRAYEAEYRRDFKKWQIASKEELLLAIGNARVLMLADFHALHQSQRAQLRILRMLPRERKVYLAVEFLFAEDQAWIDSYLLGEISEPQFLEKIRWSERWGFPFKNYRVILDWARRNNIIVRGINKYFKTTSATSLLSRDQAAAEWISDLVLSDSEALTIVIYGDLHLASSHLPAEIEKILGSEIHNQIVRVFQNSEEVYFDIASQGLDLRTDLVALGSSAFCLLNIAPWVKWQNYLMYLEQSLDSSLGNEFDDEDEGEVDAGDQVAKFVEILSSDLRLPMNLSNLSVYSANSENFWDLVKSRYASEELSWIEELVNQEVSFYLPEVRSGYLSRMSVNHGAALALQYLGFSSGEEGELLVPRSEVFLKLILQEGFVYFGSKLVNPKRKTPTLRDLQSALLAQDEQEVVLAAMRLALAQRLTEMTSGDLARRSRAESAPLVFFLASRFLGGMLGEKLFLAYRQGLVDLTKLRTWLRSSFVSGELDMSLYKEVLKAADVVELPFVSKEEVI